MDTSQAMKASALDLSVSQWFNAKNAITLEQLRGRIIVIGAFQMLCPTCVSQSIPQLIKLHQAFPEDRLIVIGLHTVFEHHQAMQSHALEAFIHEYRIRFPVGVDTHERDDPVPRTMRSLQLRGTPSTIVLDAAGDIRLHRFGHVDDFSLGFAIGQLLQTVPTSERDASEGVGRTMQSECDVNACSITNS
ncbi:MAG: redoxin domain-containing protein [Casimicrobium sp.]